MAATTVSCTFVDSRAQARAQWKHHIVFSIQFKLQHILVHNPRRHASVPPARASLSCMIDNASHHYVIEVAVFIVFLSYLQRHSCWLKKFQHAHSSSCLFKLNMVSWCGHRNIQYLMSFDFTCFGRYFYHQTQASPETKKYGLIKTSIMRLMTEKHFCCWFEAAKQSHELQYKSQKIYSNSFQQHNLLQIEELVVWPQQSINACSRAGQNWYE